jgi:hypothetical protein
MTVREIVVNFVRLSEYEKHFLLLRFVQKILYTKNNAIFVILAKIYDFPAAICDF